MNNSELYAFVNGCWDITEINQDGDNQTIYQGKGNNPDAASSQAVWCIKKTTITKSGSVQTVVEQFADGNMQYDNVWDDRATLNYKYLG